MNQPVESVPFISTERLRDIRNHLQSGLVERDLPIRLALLAALAGEHLLMVGPPGTAKSLVARRLHEAFADDRYFERLLTRFSVPEELFGPLSIKGLEQDRYERLTASYLPTASIAFLDEVFKANSAILNSLLTLLNEREFDNGTKRDKAPLVAVVAASNELPEGEELDALFDRFLLRLHVGEVSAEAFPQLLTLKGNLAVEVPAALKLTVEELQAFQAQAEAVELPQEIIQLLQELRAWCVEQSLPVSDRRWRKLVKLLRTSAWSNGRQQVSIWDAWLLQHCLWSKADQQALFADWYAKRMGATQAVSPEWLIRQVSAWKDALKRDRSSKTHMRNECGDLLYLTPDGRETTEASTKTTVERVTGRAQLYFAPAGAERRYVRHAAEVVSPDNDGKGYAAELLNDLFVPSARCHFSDWADRSAYLNDRANFLARVQNNAPLLGAQQKRAYVEDRIAQIGKLLHHATDHQCKLQHRISEIQSDVRQHLWISEDFAATASQELAKAHAAVDGLTERLIKVKKGYIDLPVEPDVAGLALDDSRNEIGE